MTVPTSLQAVGMARFTSKYLSILIAESFASGKYLIGNDCPHFSPLPFPILFYSRWDIRTKRCFDRFKNEDGTPSSSLSASARFLAVGAESGVVNVYNNRGAASSGSFASKRQPVKSVMNLQTSADYVKFNHDGQILAMASRREKNSMKLLHIPSQTVFSNWPTSKTPLNYVWSMDFSPGSKYMTMGNDQGKCLLYRLPHYDDQ